MKKISKFYTYLIVLFLSLTPLASYATAYVVWGTSVSLYAQSQVYGSGHMVQASKGILNNTTHPWCGNRMYIDTTDKALFAVASGAWLSGKVVNIIYDDAAPGVTIAGHIGGLQCRIMSIF